MRANDASTKKVRFDERKKKREQCRCDRGSRRGLMGRGGELTSDFRSKGEESTDKRHDTSPRTRTREIKRLWFSSSTRRGRLAHARANITTIGARYDWVAFYPSCQAGRRQDLAPTLLDVGRATGADTRGIRSPAPGRARKQGIGCHAKRSKHDSSQGFTRPDKHIARHDV